MTTIKLIIAAALTSSITLSFIIAPKNPTIPRNATHPAATIKAREVLTAQKLVLVELKPSLTHKDSVHFEFKLRDVFTVINYEKNKSSVLLDWTVCPDGNCPEAKLYYPKTTAYRELDVLVQDVLKTNCVTKISGR
jgi:hypothetical protein